MLGAVKAMKVRADGRDRHAKARRDLLIAETTGHHARDLSLPWCQFHTDLFSRLWAPAHASGISVQVILAIPRDVRTVERLIVYHAGGSALARVVTTEELLARIPARRVDAPPNRPPVGRIDED
jgi:hypothetical protein